MATYDYKCDDCNNVQEEIHPMAGPTYDIVCKNCESKNMSKQIGKPYSIFEGPGWETNDNRGIAKTEFGGTIDSNDAR